MNRIRSSFALARACFLAGSICVAAMFPAAAVAQGLRPGSLLVFYGYPSSINTTWSVPGAAQEFGRYDFVVWGDGLDDPSHPDHANAVAILAHAATSATRIFGYVDLGVSTQNLSVSQIQSRLGRWDAMGVNGVLLDDFGYDFGVSRARQNAAVDHAHTLGLAVIANAFRPTDAFGGADPVHNPSGLGTSLGSGDYYLYESHGVRLGEFEDAAAWSDRSAAIEGFRQAIGFRVLSITTTATDGPQAYDASRFFYAWHAALLSGHEATGWGEYGFSAYGASNGLAPYRARPTLDPGSSYLTPVLRAGWLFTRHTDLGRIELDSDAHSFGFSPASLGAPGESGEPGWADRRLVAFPNPARTGTRITFMLEQVQDARLAIYDAGGRRVASHFAPTSGAGRHEWHWRSVDGAGRRVAAGIYLAVLEAGGIRTSTRLVLLR